MKMMMKPKHIFRANNERKPECSFIRRDYFGIFIVLLCLFVSGPLYAQSVQDNFTSSLTSDQIERFSDYTVEEVLARIPGIQVDRDGNVNLRGAGQKRYYVTVDGQRMGTTGLGDRGADLSAISVDMIKEVEFIKVLTPEMAADGLAGVINLITYQANSDETIISGGLNGGLTSEHVDRIGPSARAWLGYSAPLSETISIAIKANYQRDQKAWQSLSMKYGSQDFGNGNVDVIDRISPGFQTSGSNRFASSLNLDFNPNESTSLYIRGFVNRDYTNAETQRNNWLSNSSWDDQFNTSFQSIFGYDVQTLARETSQYTFQAGGEHNFNLFNLDFAAGWAKSNIYQTEYLFPFEAAFTQYTVDFDDRTRPTAETVNEPPTSGDLRLKDMGYVINHQIDTKITGNINVEIPIKIGSLKLGSSTLITNKDANDKGAYGNYTRRYGIPPLTLKDFEKYDFASLSVFDDRYTLGRLVNADEAEHFYQSSIPNMRLDEVAYYKNSSIYNYFGKENTFAGYGMLTLEFDRLTFIGGLRAEYSYLDYEGRKVEFTRFDRFSAESDTSLSNNYLNFFPNAQVSFQLNANSSISAAYSRSMARPDFQELTPFEMVLPQDTLIYKGNINLKPVLSDNFDLSMKYALANTGMLTIGGFYKNITNLVILRSQDAQIQLGEYPEFDAMFEAGENEMMITERSFQNSANSASVYGVEVAIEQQLTFLPGALSNLSTYANYTWSQSEFDSGRGEKTELPGQSPHVINAALGYSQNKFSTMLSYHWSAESLSQLQDKQELAPSISSSEVYLDRYQDGYKDLSLNMQYQLNNQFQIWGNVYNLLQKEQVEYAHTEEFYPTSIYQREGIEFNIGVRFNL